MTKLLLHSFSQLLCSHRSCGSNERGEESSRDTDIGCSSWLLAHQLNNTVSHRNHCCWWSAFLIRLVIALLAWTSMRGGHCGNNECSWLLDDWFDSVTKPTWTMATTTYNCVWLNETIGMICFLQCLIQIQINQHNLQHLPCLLLKTNCSIFYKAVTPSLFIKYAKGNLAPLRQRQDPYKNWMYCMTTFSIQPPAILLLRWTVIMFRCSTATALSENIFIHPF